MSVFGLMFMILLYIFFGAARGNPEYKVNDSLRLLVFLTKTVEIHEWFLRII